MLEKINRWLLGVFSNKDVNNLVFLILGVVAVIWMFGGELAAVMTAILVSYVLEGAVQRLLRFFSLSRVAAVSLVVAFTLLGAVVAAYFLPQFLFQLRELGDKLPEAARLVEGGIVKINHYLPAAAALDKNFLAEEAKAIANSVGKYLFSNTLTFAGNVLSLIIHAILLPLLVFFLLKDKDALLAYAANYVKPTPILRELWREVDAQFGSYVRGKFIEGFIVGAVSWVMFFLFDMNYGFALAVMIGLSVFVPFVGAVLVTVPVVLFAYLQYGWHADFVWVVGLYGLVQMFDGQLLVPFLFSEAVKIHIVALLAAIVFFGNLWGVLGVFFAIPLAALIKSVINVIDKHKAAAAS